MKEGMMNDQKGRSVDFVIWEYASQRRPFSDGLEEYS
ncbi:hypothetical protein B23_3212 [Geobacillus thermoleovorans B23]|nr:hypothetical protein B23_3212 [Geobacillus thermoleovorans B23]